MVYVQPSLLGWRPLVESWMDQLPQTYQAKHKEALFALFDWLVPPALRLVTTKEIPSVLPMQEINLAVSCMQLFESLLGEWRTAANVRASVHPIVHSACLKQQSFHLPG